MVNMKIHKLVSDQKQYGYESKPKVGDSWVLKAGYPKREETVTAKGIKYEVVKTKYERHHPFFSKKRVAGIALGVFAVIGTLGFSLLSKTVRQLFTGRQVLLLTIREQIVLQPKPAEGDPHTEALLEEMLQDLRPQPEDKESSSSSLEAPLSEVALEVNQVFEEVVHPQPAPLSEEDFLRDAMSFSAEEMETKYHEFLSSGDKESLIERAVANASTLQLIELYDLLNPSFHLFAEKLEKMSFEELACYEAAFDRGLFQDGEVRECIAKKFEEYLKEHEITDVMKFQKFMAMLPPESLLMTGLLTASVIQKKDLNNHSNELIEAVFTSEDYEGLLEKELEYIETNQKKLANRFGRGPEWESYLEVLHLLASNLSEEQKLRLGDALNANFPAYVEKFKQDPKGMLIEALNDKTNLSLLRMAIQLEVVDLTHQVENEPLLHVLVDQDSEKVSALLKGLDVNLNVQNTSGNTLLHLALSQNRPELAKILIKLGARVDIKNGEEKTPIQIAVDLGFLPIAVKMIRDVMVEMRRDAVGLPGAKKEKLLAKKIRQGKMLNHAKKLNRKEFQKAFGKKLVPKPLRGVGDVINFGGAAYQLWEADSIFAAKQLELENEIQRLKAEKRAESVLPARIQEIETEIENKREALVHLEEDRRKNQNRNAVELAGAAMPAGRYAAQLIPGMSKAIKKFVPGISAFSAGVTIYKALDEQKNIDEKVKLLTDCKNQVEYELEMIREFQTSLPPEHFLHKLLDWKRREFETKAAFLQMKLNEADMSQKAQQIAAGGNVGVIMTFVGGLVLPFAMPVVGPIAALAGNAPALVDLYGAFRAWMGDMTDADFQPISEDNFESRKARIALRLGVLESNLDQELEELSQVVENKWLKGMMKRVDPEEVNDESFAEQKKFLLLNYLLN